MKLKIISAVLSLIAAAAVFSGCGDKTENTNSSSEGESPKISEEPAETAAEESETITEIITAVPDETEDTAAAEQGTAMPVLSLSNTEVMAGDTAEIILSVSGADEKWAMCGLHITYPEELVCEMQDEEERTIKYKLGDASELSMGAVGMLWAEGLPDELMEKHLGCFFFTEMFGGNEGYDGEIAKFYLKIPDDAQSGTVYPLSYYFQETDLFTNDMQDEEMQEYAFTHALDGSVTVK
ncbi:MAG: hypothetical protein IJ666_04490 [Ruminococcus sp.]|nr:hypothetical protein [Ruminococcus sp.]